jgi:hypothetical protein
MAPITLTPISLGAVVRLRKAHPCGGYDWTVVRMGADIGLKCATCGHRVLLSRRDFERRLAKVLSHAAAQSEENQAPNGDRARA